MTQEETQKLAYDADYSCLKKKFQHVKAPESVEEDEGTEIVDYDRSSDGDWVDNYDELRCGYL